MITPELKFLHSPDVYDLAVHEPKDQRNFSILIQAMIGPEGSNTMESFDVVVCTPEWVQSHCLQEPLMGRHFLVVHEYSYDEIRQFIRAYARRCRGETWEEVGEKLGRLGKWEFEDYRP